MFIQHLMNILPFQNSISSIFKCPRGPFSTSLSSIQKGFLRSSLCIGGSFDSSSSSLLISSGSSMGSTTIGLPSFGINDPGKDDVVPTLDRAPWWLRILKKLFYEYLSHDNIVTNVVQQGLFTTVYYLILSWSPPARSSLGTGDKDGPLYEPSLEDRNDRRKLDFRLDAQAPALLTPGIPSSILLNLPATSSREAAIFTSWVCENFYVIS